MGKNLDRSWIEAQKTQHTHEYKVQILINYFVIFVFVEFVYFKV
jgi:hypothetical protein